MKQSPDSLQKQPVFCTSILTFQERKSCSRREIYGSRTSGPKCMEMLCYVYILHFYDDFLTINFSLLIPVCSLDYRVLFSGFVTQKNDGFCLTKLCAANYFLKKNIQSLFLRDLPYSICLLSRIAMLQQ